MTGLNFAWIFVHLILLCYSHAQPLLAPDNSILARAEPSSSNQTLSSNLTAGTPENEQDVLSSTTQGLLSQLESKWHYKRRGYDLQRIIVISRSAGQALQLDRPSEWETRVVTVKASKKKAFLNVYANAFGVGWKSPEQQIYDPSQGASWRWEDVTMSLQDVSAHSDFTGVRVGAIIMVKPYLDPIDGTTCQEPFYQLEEDNYSRTPGSRWWFGMKTGRLYKDHWRGLSSSGNGGAVSVANVGGGGGGEVVEVS